MKKILIKKGKIIDPSQKMEKESDLLIEDGKIKSIAKQIKASGAEVINAKGMLVMPGLIDMHAHLRDPGNPEEETIASGTASAALGGFTTIACMANTHPPIDTPSAIKYIVSKAKAEGKVNVLPIGAVTKSLAGEEMAEIGRMLDEGAIAFSDDGKPITNSEVFRHALEYAQQFNALIIDHCEDLTLSSGGQMNEGYLSTVMGLKGIPKLAEENMISRDIALLKEFGGKLHIAHVSCASSVKLIREAKKQKLNITAETAPHYLTLTEKAIEGYNTLAKVNPPLRQEADIKEIIKGLKDGTIDAIATDHAPHIIEHKNVEFDQASTGMVGFETALALVLTKLVMPGLLPLTQAIAKLTSSPAKILGINKGTLKIGADADIIIVDPKKEWTVEAEKLASKSKNTPFDGWKLQGKVEHTIVGGNLVIKGGKLI